MIKIFMINGYFFNFVFLKLFEIVYFLFLVIINDLGILIVLDKVVVGLMEDYMIYVVNFKENIDKWEVEIFLS